MLLLVGAVQAQDCPNKPVRLIIGFPPGGANDILGRYIAPEYLSQRLIDQGIREVDGAIIMDPLAIGIKRYQAGVWAIPPEEVRKILASEFETGCL